MGSCDQSDRTVCFIPVMSHNLMVISKRLEMLWTFLFFTSETQTSVSFLIVSQTVVVKIISGAFLFMMPGMGPELLYMLGSGVPLSQMLGPVSSF